MESGSNSAETYINAIVSAQLQGRQPYQRYGFEVEISGSPYHPWLTAWSENEKPWMWCAQFKSKRSILSTLKYVEKAL